MAAQFIDSVFSWKIHLPPHLPHLWHYDRLKLIPIWPANYLMLEALSTQSFPSWMGPPQDTSFLLFYKLTGEKSVKQFYWKNSTKQRHLHERICKNVQRFRRSLREFFLSQAAFLEPPFVWVNLRPFPSPRDDFPAWVRPRSSRCFWTGLVIQLIFGSRLMALWNGSIMMTSKYL